MKLNDVTNGGRAIAARLACVVALAVMLGGILVNGVQAALLPVVTSATRTYHLDASNINNDGGATNPGNGNAVNTWTDQVGGSNLNHNFPIDGKGTFISAGNGGVGNQDTVRFNLLQRAAT